MNLFKIDLRLKPAAPGERELSGWPAQEFTPDFIVAASGLTRVELESKVIGITADTHKPVATATDHLGSKQVNYWLPDYTAGFALNLAAAAVQLKQGAASAHARFMDEPLELHLEKSKILPGSFKISFRYNGEVISDAEAPGVLVLAEIARTVLDFLVQLVHLNPRLYEQPDVTRLRAMVGQIML